VNTDYLKGWDCESENHKAEFMNYLYKASGRTNGLYTGLWKDFCASAGEQLRKDFFDGCKACKVEK